MIPDIVAEYHNQDYVNPDASPNGNYVIMVFSDGMVVDTKGGRAFLQSTMFIQCYNGEHFNIIPNVCWEMPCIFHDKTYAIVGSLDEAYQIREEMKKNPIPL